MNKRIFKNLFAVATMLCSCCAIMAQGTSSTTSEKLKAAVSEITSCPVLIQPRGEVNARKSPAANAPVVCKINEQDIHGSVYGVEEERNGWYKITINDPCCLETQQSAWVKGTVVKKLSNDPITPDMQNTLVCGRVESYDWSGEWRVFVRPDNICIGIFYNSNYNTNTLMLGKYVDNVCCFLYKMDLQISSNEYDDNPDPKKLSIREMEQDDWKTLEVIYGKNYEVTARSKATFEDGEGYSTQCIDLSKLNDKFLWRVFQNVVESGKKTPKYINSTLLSGEYANYLPG